MVSAAEDTVTSLSAERSHDTHTVVDHGPSVYLLLLLVLYVVWDPDRL